MMKRIENIPQLDNNTTNFTLFDELNSFVFDVKMLYFTR